LGFKQQERDWNLFDSLRQHENTRDAHPNFGPKLLEPTFGKEVVSLAETTGEGMMLSESLRFGRKAYNQTNEFFIS
jgi:hypothetical protein